MERKSGMEKKTVTRRDFVKGTVCGTLGFALGLKALGDPAKAMAGVVPGGIKRPANVSEVVLVRDGRAVDSSHRISMTAVSEMIETAVKTFVAANMARSWKLYICPLDMLGSEYVRHRVKKTRTDREVIYAVIVPLERYADLIDNSGAILGKAWRRANLESEKRLVIVDALRPFHPWDYKGILVGDDPVAVGTVCHRIHQTRNSMFEWPVDLGAKSVAVTIDTEYGSKTSDLPEIKSVRAV